MATTRTGAARTAPAAAACAALLLLLAAAASAAAPGALAPAALAYAVEGTGDMAGTALGPAWQRAPAPEDGGRGTAAPAPSPLRSGILAVPDEYLRPADGIGRYVVLGGASPLVAVLHDSEAAALRARGHSVMQDFRVDLHAAPSVPDPEPPARRGGANTGEDGGGAGGLPDASRLAELVSSAASAARGYDGSGVRIAVVDTGVDFSNPDMHHAVARDASGAPIMLDADGQGIVLTNATFAANIDGDGVVRSFGRAGEEAARENHTSVVYRTRDGVFLDVEQGGKGTTIPVYNSFYPGAGPLPVFNGTMSDDMRIGDGATDYIRSQSGVYRLGAIYQGTLSGRAAGLQVVPVLLVDSREAGVYDTVVPDLSSAHADFYSSELDRGEEPDYDFDFTDEEPIRLGEGAEFLVHDSDGDGLDDFSAGMVGARVLDVYGVTSGARAAAAGGDGASHLHDVLNAVNGTLLPPIDPDGEFFGIMADLVGHGSASAAAIASAGRQGYDVYNNSEKYTARGVAPGASIVPIKALWFGDTLYASMWAAGFDAAPDGDGENGGAGRGWSWRYSGAPRADVITHSWGISAFPAIGAVPGADAVSLVQGMIAVPHSLDKRYPGVLVVASAGNSGHGYGTTGTPGASPFVLTVGAATSNAFVGHGAFAGQPRFGNTTEHGGHLVDFTSRGPTPLGHPKPDIVGVGAYGFVPSPVTRPPRAESHEPFGLYGGTSMAAPTVAASAAILIEAMRGASSPAPSPQAVRSLLMSAASDTGNDALVQGAGMVDVDAAVGAALGENGGFAASVPESYGAARASLAAAVESANATEFGADRFVLPRGGPSPASWFAGVLHAGERATASIAVSNPSNETLHVRVEPQRLGLIGADSLAGSTVPRAPDPDVNETGKYAPNYVRLEDARERRTVASYLAAPGGVPDGAGLLVLTVGFGMGAFMNSSAEIYADDLSIASLYLYDWDDADGDRTPSSSELSMVSRAGSWGTVQEMRVSDPASLFRDTPLVGVYPVPDRYSYWRGANGMDASPLPYAVGAAYYTRERWDDVWVSSRTLEVPPGETRSARATLVVPDGLPSGVYQGFVRVSSFDGSLPVVDPPRGASSPAGAAGAAPGSPGRAVPFVADIPVSYAVAEPVPGPGTVVVGDLEGAGGAGGAAADAGAGPHILDGSGRVRGAFDMTNRYMSGDWRAVYFDVADGSIDTALVDIAWDDPGTTLAAFVAGPDGGILSSTAGAGSFAELLGWPSSDWLGPTPFSEGGGFYPVEARPPSSTGLLAPVNGTGVYTVLMHSTLFGAEGGGTSERVSVVAEFLDLPGRLGRGR